MNDDCSIIDILPRYSPGGAEEYHGRFSVNTSLRLILEPNRESLEYDYIVICK
jgi:hypothetical protein